MLEPTDKLSVSMDALNAYHFFHLKHDWSMEALHALVLNDVYIAQGVTKASSDYGFDKITTKQFVRAINDAITDRNSLRHLMDTKVEFTPEQMETTYNDFQRILLDQMNGYLKTAEQDLDDKGIRHMLRPGIGLDIIDL